jgi:uncharacterized damage-inducible protein DinB
MNRRQAIARVAAGGLAAAPAASAAWKNAFAEQLEKDLLGHWASEREYSLAIVGAMPEEKLDYRPGLEVRTFAEQAVHFGRAQVAYFSMLKLLDPPPPPEEATDAATVKAYVAQSFDYVRDVLTKAGEAEFLRRDVAFGRTGVLHTTQDLWLRGALHTAHHRGQMVVYLRLNGIEPPAWQFAPQGG